MRSHESCHEKQSKQAHQLVLLFRLNSKNLLNKRRKTKELWIPKNNGRKYNFGTYLILPYFIPIFYPT